MKKNKKIEEKKIKLFGFTLIELLAVIVVLAIIALIATPIVLNIINNAKDSANKRSVELYCSAVKNAVVIKSLEMEVPSGTYTTLDSHKFIINNEEVSIDYEGNDVNCTLQIEENGNIKLTNCKVDNVSVDYGCNNGEVVETENEEETDEEDDNTSTKVYTNGEAVYFNVTTGVKCSETDAVSTTGTKSGCMKFYAFNDEGESSNTINLILDHNTTATIEWINETDFISSGGIQTDWENRIRNHKGPLTALTQLKTDTENWTGVETPNSYANSHYGYTVDYLNYGGKARLITVQEIAQITGNTSWDESDTNAGWYYLDSKDQDDDKAEKAQGASNYAWLFDYTGFLDGEDEFLCTDYGCNTGDTSTAGYWTVSADSSNADNAWYVEYDSIVSNDAADVNDFTGIRPVITVLKSKLS